MKNILCILDITALTVIEFISLKNNEEKFNWDGKKNKINKTFSICSTFLFPSRVPSNKSALAPT